MVISDIVFWPFGVISGFIYFWLSLILLVLIIWMIIDCMQRKFKVEAERWIWIALIVLTRGVGAIVYFIMVKNLYPKGVSKK